MLFPEINIKTINFVKYEKRYYIFEVNLKARMGIHIPLSPDKKIQVIKILVGIIK